MVIYGPDIHECARIMGRYELKTSDQRLAEIWKDHITPLVHTDDAWWEKTVIGILAGYSYRGERVE
jgi:hypothetical protein